MHTHTQIYHNMIYIIQYHFSGDKNKKIVVTNKTNVHDDDA